MRVLAHDRVGYHRACSSEPGELERALRAALAAARNPEHRSNRSLGSAAHAAAPRPLDHFDPVLATLELSEARRVVAPLCRTEGRARLEWGTITRVVVGSASTPRWAAATLATVRAANPPHLGGAAATSSRSLATLGLEALAGRLADLATNERDDVEATSGGPVVLGGEAMAQLLGLLAIHAFSIRAYSHGRSVLRDLLHEQLLDRKLSVIDDGNDPAGLPFPFDLAGQAKRRIEMVASGVARTPAVRATLATELGLPPTPHLWAADDARPEHLFVEAGSANLADLLAAAEGGVWISNFRALECPDPRRLRIRAIAGGVRRIRGGRLVATMPRQLWETSLLNTLGRVEAISKERVRLADPTSSIGSLVAPALLLSEVAGLQRAR